MTIEVAPTFDGLSIEALLIKWHIPRKERYLLLEEKRLTVNGNLTNSKKVITATDKISIQWNEPESSLVLGDRSACELLYENELFVIANKPEGMKTHGNKIGDIALQNHVMAITGAPVYVVHRLDVATSGCVLFAKNIFMLPILSTLMESHSIHRTYEALVKGHFKKEELTFDASIGHDRHDARKWRVSPNGRTAITHIKVLSILLNSSLIECQLETGRTHQIRVHLSSSGHPILGDDLYGNTTHNRLMLHAKRIAFYHPFTRELIKISASSQTFSEYYQQEKANETKRNRCTRR